MPGERVGALSKAELRTEMRRARRAIEDVAERSRLIWARVTALDGLRSARRLMVFTSIPGEPDTSSFIRWCASRDKGIAVPEDEPDPKWPDVVIVPGLAFTVAGERLGQGGGWYDRFLAQCREDCVTVGVGFREQVVDSLPTEDHDVVLDIVVTDG
ncbi:MAG: 5-formyltetrahydrofolate cyclo-ligase [Acidimicrobiia bacterium]|nr:5-formyltetrahydrofolate cyclo-ligase [Acidimicrobiia bacterium]